MNTINTLNNINTILNAVVEKANEMPASKGTLIKKASAKAIVTTAKTAKATALVAKIVVNKRARRLAIGAVKLSLSQFITRQEEYLKSLEQADEIQPVEIQD